MLAIDIEQRSYENDEREWNKRMLSPVSMSQKPGKLSFMVQMYVLVRVPWAFHLPAAVTCLVVGCEDMQGYAAK